MQHVAMNKTPPKTEERVRQIFNEYMEQARAGKNPSLYDIQRRHGYTESSARGYAVTRTRAWNDIMEEVDEEKVVGRLEQIAFEGKDSDSLNAIDKLLKLKNRYPDKGRGGFLMGLGDIIEVEPDEKEKLE